MARFIFFASASVLPGAKHSRSICSTSWLGRRSRASAIRHIVSKLACFVPFSIIVKCVLAMPAKPLSTSCDSPRSRRSERIVRPAAPLSNSNTLHPSFPPDTFSLREIGGKYVYDSRYFPRHMLRYGHAHMGRCR